MYIAILGYELDMLYGTSATSAQYMKFAESLRQPFLCLFTLPVLSNPVIAKK
jgi:hypothetical protein